MCPALVQELAERLTRDQRKGELADFVALLLLRESWADLRVRSLGDMAFNIRLTALSSAMEDPLQFLSDPELFSQRSKQGHSDNLSAVQAAQFAIHTATRMAGMDQAALKRDTRPVLEAVLQKDIQKARKLFNDIQDELCHWNPEVAENNELLRWDEPDQGGEGWDSIEPPSAATPDKEGKILLIGPAGVPLGLFSSHEEAMMCMVQHLMQHRNALPQALPPGEGADTAPPSKPKPAAVVEHALKRGSFQVFQQSAASVALQKLPPAGPYSDGNAQLRRLLESMASDTGVRTLVEAPVEAPLARMYKRFPHFKEVLDFIARNLALASCGDEGRPVRIPPILLRGTPGTGKTYFAQELAKALGTYFVERDLSVTTEAFVISGMDSSWKNSKPGVVFESLVSGQTANPLILLNEVDKAKAGGTHNSPISALYALLEPTSAARFVDEFAAVEIDASRVVWVLTANDGEIPDPILSRLEVFNIPEPTQEDCRAIAQSVWDSLLSTALPRGHGFPADMDEPVLAEMSRMSPRIMRKALTMAASAAAMAGRKSLQVEDLALSNKRYASPERRTMGFLS